MAHGYGEGGGWVHGEGVRKEALCEPECSPWATQDSWCFSRLEEQLCVCLDYVYLSLMSVRKQNFHTAVGVQPEFGAEQYVGQFAHVGLYMHNEKLSASCCTQLTHQG